MAAIIREVNKTLVNQTASIRKEVSTPISLSNSQISYTLADRNNTSSKYGHYFATFNMPYKGSNSVFYSGDTLARANPELFQLNVDRIAVIPISENYYSEYIDGRSITLKVPQWGGTYKTVISSFYSDKARTVKLADSTIPYFGPNNVAFLFSDDVNKPYTGTTEGKTISHAEVTTWEPTTDFRDRPSGVAYNQDIKDVDFNSDQRTWSSVKYAVPVHQSYPKANSGILSTSNGYNYDIPVGFVCLDKGFIILTHP